MTTKQIEEAALKLSKRDRARLAEKLQDSLRTREEREILDAWIKEAERRNQEMESGKVVGIPADEVFRRVRASFR